MAAKARATFSLMKTVVDEARNSSNSVSMKVVAFLGIAFLEEFFVTGIFRCPCIEDINSNNASSVVGRKNFLYGALFFAMPALCLYFLSLAQNENIWMISTGLCRNRKRRIHCNGYGTRIKALVLSNIEAVYAMLGWFTIALLDGDYGACAMTYSPYSDTCINVNSVVKDKLPFTVEYEKNKRNSQILGCFLLIILTFLYLLGVCCKRCCSSTDYESQLVVEQYSKVKDRMVKEEIDKLLKARAGKFLAEIRKSDSFKEAMKAIQKKERTSEEQDTLITSVVTNSTSDAFQEL